MSDKRDKRTPKTPPHGVAAQLAPPEGEEWVGDTGVHNRDDNTPVGLEVLDAEADMRLRHRVKETAQTTRSIKQTAEATHTGVDTLRFETRRDVARLENKIGMVSTEVAVVRAEVGNVNTKLDQHTGHVIRMVETVGELRGQVGELVKAVDHSREANQHVEMAHVDLVKFGRQTEIADAADEKKAKRERVTRLVTGIVALLSSGAVVSYIITNVSC